MLMNDAWIQSQCESLANPLIYPFYDYSVERSKGVVSYGLSSYGYDCRLAEKVQIFSNLDGRIVDPKGFDKKLMRDAEVYYDTERGVGKYVLLPPNSYALGSFVEYIRVPRQIAGICVGKSTYARCGVVVNTTPLEPEWEGFLTVEIANCSGNYVRLYVNEGIAQVLFFTGGVYKYIQSSGYIDSLKPGCERSYKDKDGKYDKQMELTYAKVK